METKIGVKEFRANLPMYLDAKSPVTITRHGETIGYYIPARQDRTELTALKEAAAKMNAMLTESGVSDDEIVAEFKALRSANP